MVAATIELSLSDGEKRELVDLTAADVIRRLAGGLSVTPNVPQLGELWLAQGGVYGGIVRPDDGSKPYHMIFQNEDAGENASVTWGSYGIDEPGATSLWDGKSNTLALVNSAHDHPAAQWAHGLVHAGHDDWYMAAQREQMLGWINVPELFAKAWYLTSTQYSSDGAWLQRFGTGHVGYCLKDDEARVRAVRRLPI